MRKASGSRFSSIPIRRWSPGRRPAAPTGWSFIPRPTPANTPPAPYLAAAEEARRQGLGLNAGHDLNLENLRFFVSRIPWTDEVSIGHALICDALYYGLENTVQLYKRELR